MKFLSILIFISTISAAQTPEWTSFFNNSANANEFIADIAFDNLGNTYLTGYGMMTSIQGEDILTVKCNSDGAVEWTKTYNGPQNDSDRPNAIFVDEQGNVYVTGTSRFAANSYKIVTMKYSPEGSLLWRSAYDSLGQSDSRAEDIYVDNNGNVLVTGWISQLNNGYYDMVTIKMNNNGNVLDFAYFGQTTNVDDFGKKIISDNSGNIFVGGDSFRNVTFGREAIIIKYNSSLDTSWVVRVNGTDNYYNEFTVDLELDDNGNVYALCRLTNSPGSTDFAVLKINSNGNVLWRTEYDEAGGQDIPEAMTMDNNGNIYVTGRVRRSGGGGYNDFAIIKYNNNGVQQWKSYYDGPNNRDDDPIDIVLDQNGNVFVCGESNRDGFAFKFIVVKYNPIGVFEWEYVYEGNVEGKALSMHPDNNGYVYAAGQALNSSGNLDLFAVKLSKTTGIGDYKNFPDMFTLYQNYPNPFNPGTKISWRTLAGIHQTLKVYDVLGNEVATLVDEYKTAGSYEVEFNVGQHSSADISSGVYFYRLQAGSFVETKKMILTK
jgi:uncharacterized delta-60 repeat protein